MSTPPPLSGTTWTGTSVTIGGLVPLTRPGWVEAGRHLLAGLELAVRDVNDAGGRIRFSRAPGISVWQWAWAPIQVVDRDANGPRSLRVLHTG